MPIKIVLPTKDMPSIIWTPEPRTLSINLLLVFIMGQMVWWAITPCCCCVKAVLWKTMLSVLPWRWLWPIRFSMDGMCQFKPLHVISPRITITIRILSPRMVTRKVLPASRAAKPTTRLQNRPIVTSTGTHRHWPTMRNSWMTTTSK